MNSLSDLKAAYDFAKMKYGEALNEAPSYGSVDSEYWYNKMISLNSKIEDSVRLLEE